jgi:UDP-N-acetylglucosamine enolpyruvyl transferase
VADGTTEIESAQYIYRGYEDIEQKLTGLGARIVS